MASTLNTTQIEQEFETALRFVEANRTRFDSPVPPPGAVERRVQALEAALAEAAEDRRLLTSLQTSTTWRLTRPIRWLVEALKGPQATPPPAGASRAIAPVSLSYEEWIRTEEAAALAALAEGGPGHWAIRPQRIGLVLLASADDPAPPDAGLNCPDGCTVLLLDRANAPSQIVSRALDQLDSGLVCFIDGRDRLAPIALSIVAQVLAQYPQTDLLFADEDWLEADGRRVRPFFKPGWDQELQRGRDLVGPFAFLRTALVRQAIVSSSPAWRYDLANQVAASARRSNIRHVPAVLCHRTVSPLGHAEAMRAACAAQLQRDGIAAQVLPAPGHPDYARVTYALPKPEPLVSVIVPTRDRADLLRACADGLLNHTSYRRLEMLIVDNGTVEPDAIELLERLSRDGRVKVLRLPGAFDWSALNNAAAAEAAGEVFVLLNNDIAVLQPDWLTVLVSHAIQPGVGAVGAKLLYPDGRVQHAGLTTDERGLPGHLFRYAPGEAAGPFNWLAVAREVWGVTGACLAIPRAAFFKVGGLNEALPVAFNDVDLCLRLTAHGYRLVWTPWSVVEHRELASRPPDHFPGRLAQAMKERDRLLRDWGSLALHDPFLNPNLQLVDENPCLRRSS